MDSNTSRKARAQVQTIKHNFLNIFRFWQPSLFWDYPGGGYYFRLHNFHFHTFCTCLVHETTEKNTNIWIVGIFIFKKST